MAVQIITSALALCTGVGIFLLACTIISNCLEKTGGERLKKLFGHAGKNRFVGVGVGAAVTAIIQSSSAASVMVIGFVNAEMMTLVQAATVIFGANIGTTVTGQLIAFGMLGNGKVTSANVLAAFVCAGAFAVCFAKSEKAKNIGGMIAGFGLLFVGMETMGGAMSGFAKLESVKNAVAAFDAPLLSVAVGAVLTAVVQSSSVMTSMTFTMTAAGLMTLDQGVYLTIGANIGTCITAVMAAVAGSKNAKCVAVIHLLFNAGGAALFLIVGATLGIFGVGYGSILDKLIPSTPQIQLALFHTVFNAATVAVALPLTKKIVWLAEKLVGGKTRDACAVGDR